MKIFFFFFIKYLLFSFPLK